PGPRRTRPNRLSRSNAVKPCGVRLHSFLRSCASHWSSSYTRRNRTSKSVKYCTVRRKRSKCAFIGRGMNSGGSWSESWLRPIGKRVHRHKPLIDCVLRRDHRFERFVEGFWGGLSYNGWHGLNIMKIIKQITAAALVATFLATPFAGLAAESKSDD